MKTHGETKNGYKSTEYLSWISMHKRCSQKYVKWIKNYKGISVCIRWTGYQGFSNFLQDMGRKPNKQYTLDRKDGTKNYEPTNCRWATVTEQNRNKRTNLKINFRGVVKCAAEWSKLLGYKAGYISLKLRRGHSLENIFNSNEVFFNA